MIYRVFWSPTTLKTLVSTNMESILGVKYLSVFDLTVKILKYLLGSYFSPVPPAASRYDLSIAEGGAVSQFSVLYERQMYSARFTHGINIF